MLIPKATGGHATDSSNSLVEPLVASLPKAAVDEARVERLLRGDVEGENRRSRRGDARGRESPSDQHEGFPTPFHLSGYPRGRDPARSWALKMSLGLPVSRRTVPDVASISTA